MVRLRNLISLFLFVWLFNFVDLAKVCDPKSFEDFECPENQVCVDFKGTGSCRCRPGFMSENETPGAPCIRIEHFPTTEKSAQLTDDSGESGGNSHVVAGILIPLFLIVIVIVVFVSYKYRVVGWVRSKINQRSTNYDEFIIGQGIEDDDDPPLR